MSSWSWFWFECAKHAPTLCPVLAFVTSIALPRKSFKSLLSLSLEETRNALNICASNRHHTIIGNLFLPSLAQNDTFSWEQFRQDIQTLTTSLHLTDLIVEINIHLQFAIMMCCVGTNGILHYFHFLEGGKSQKVLAQSDCAFICFRPSLLLPTSITDLSEPKNIICAYVPPQIPVVGNYNISISDMWGEIRSTVSCSLGSLDEPQSGVDITTPTSASLPINKQPIVSSHISNAMRRSEGRCPTSPCVDPFSSPEVARNAPTCDLQAGDTLSSFDSPISLSENLPEVFDRGDSTKLEKCDEKEYDSLKNIVLLPVKQVTVTETLDAGSGSVIGGHNQRAENAFLAPVKSTTDLSDEAKAERKLLQAKSKAFHENIKQSLVELGYSKEEIIAVKGCLVDYVKERYPDMNSFERTEKMQSCVTKDIISNLDIEKRLTAMRSSKIKKWIAVK